MKYEKVWCDPMPSDLDFNQIRNLETLVIELENNDCSFKGIHTNQIFEVHIYDEKVDITYIYMSTSLQLVDIFNIVYMKHCKEV